MFLAKGAGRAEEEQKQGTGRQGVFLGGGLTIEFILRKHVQHQRQGKHSDPMCREAHVAKRVASRYREGPLSGWSGVSVCGDEGLVGWGGSPL